MPFFRHKLLTSPLIYKRVLQAGLLSLGSPLGWMLIRALLGIDVVADIALHWGVYLYMTTGTALVFMGFGYYVGLNEERLSQLTLTD